MAEQQPNRGGDWPTEVESGGDWWNSSRMVAAIGRENGRGEWPSDGPTVVNGQMAMDGDDRQSIDRTDRRLIAIR